MADKLDPKEVTSGKGYKKDVGKARFDLIPIKPLIMLANLYAKGAIKYAERNWERGMDFGRLYAAAMRHILYWWGGEKYDPVDGQHHLIAAIWNLFALVELEETHPECDKRTSDNTRHKKSEEDYG